MTSQSSPSVTLEEFKVIVQRAGLDLNAEELEHLLPMYRQLLGQLAAIHDPALPLGLPADVFSPDWE